MYCVLTEKTALRSWPHVPYAYYTKEDPYAKSLTKDEFEHLLLCDGKSDLKPDETIQHLLKKGLIRECKKGERNSSWSSFRKYENRYFPKMNFMMTGKCNCNCLHCFNAADCLTNGSKSFRRGRVGWNPSRSEECLHELSHGDELQEYGF